MDSAALASAIAAVCPIDGVAGPCTLPAPWPTHPAGDGSQWRIDFSANATAAQQQAAIAALAAYVDAAVVPPFISNYQARTILIQQGYLAKVDVALRGADQLVMANQIALAAWDYANNFYRSDPLIAAMGAVIPLTSAQIDQMFIAAAKIGN